MDGQTTRVAACSIVASTPGAGAAPTADDGGVAAYHLSSADTPKALLRAADKALYSAKEHGRNQVVAVIDGSVERIA